MPNSARVTVSVSAAHSAIAVYERAPANTAHTATDNTLTSRCRTPTARPRVSHRGQHPQQGGPVGPSRVDGGRRGGQVADRRVDRR
jgi:hypothetical protein